MILAIIPPQITIIFIKNTSEESEEKRSYYLGRSIPNKAFLRLWISSGFTFTILSNLIAGLGGLTGLR